MLLLLLLLIGLLVFIYSLHLIFPFKFTWFFRRSKADCSSHSWPGARARPIDRRANHWLTLATRSFHLAYHEASLTATQSIDSHRKSSCVITRLVKSLYIHWTFKKLGIRIYSGIRLFLIHKIWIQYFTQRKVIPNYLTHLIVGLQTGTLIIYRFSAPIT